MSAMVITSRSLFPTADRSTAMRTAHGWNDRNSPFPSRLRTTIASSSKSHSSSFARARASACAAAPPPAESAATSSGWRPK